MVKKEKTFEEALEELEEIVKQLENGKVPLEEALKQFQKGMELSSYCNETLAKAEKAVTKMMIAKAGGSTEEE